MKKKKKDLKNIYNHGSQGNIILKFLSEQLSIKK